MDDRVTLTIARSSPLPVHPLVRFIRQNGMDMASMVKNPSKM